jgi:hypothetical protein
VTKRIRDIPKEVADDLRTLELARLDDLQTILYNSVRMAVAAEAPPPTGAIEQILRIMDRRAKYLGLYKEVDNAVGTIARGLTTAPLPSVSSLPQNWGDSRKMAPTS